MTPLNNNDPYITSSGKRSTLGAEMGGGQYSLPTASSQTKGGIKIGSGLTMVGEKLNVDNQLPAHTETDAGKVLTVDENGDLDWEDPPPSITWKTQQQWDALTFAQKKALGFTAIGADGDISGNYYDYSEVTEFWRLNPTYDNVLDVFDSRGFNFHGFYSNTIGDIVQSQGRGGTRAENDKAFICNGITDSINNYGFFMMFATTEAALACTDTSFYTINKIKDYNLYCGNLNTGAWPGNTHVSFTHDGTTQNLMNMFTEDEYTIRGITISNNEIVIPSAYHETISSIIDYLNS